MKLLAVLATVMCLGCATVKLAATQCGAAGEFKAAGAKLAPVEAQALTCLASGAESTVEACETKVGASVVALGVVNSPTEVGDALKCAAAFVADLAAEKANEATAIKPDAGP
jgi:hypothetical protein